MPLFLTRIGFPARQGQRRFIFRAANERESGAMLAKVNFQITGGK